MDTLQSSRIKLYSMLLTSIQETVNCSVYDSTEVDITIDLLHGIGISEEDLERLKKNTTFENMLIMYEQERQLASTIKNGVIIIIEDNQLACVMGWRYDKSQNFIEVDHVDCYIKGYCRLLFYRFY